MRKLTLLLISLVSLYACQESTSPHNGLDAFFEDHIDQNHIPGLAGAIVSPDSVIWQQAYGFADLENRVPMSVHHIQNIASVSKTFTSTAVMQLWEQGKLDLQADVNTYLPIPVRNPAFPNTPITVFQLLTHTSSIIDGPAYGESYACGDPVVSLKDWIEGYLQMNGPYYDAEGNYLSGEPGTEREYSNVGYGLLGYMVEQISGQAFSEYCQVHIFDPLGMTHTGWFLSDIDTRLHSQTYIWQRPAEFSRIAESGLVPNVLAETDSGHVATCPYSFFNYPDGLLRTSVEDLSRFMQVWLNQGRYPGGQLLKPETIDQVLSPQLEGNKRQGLCWSYTGFEAVWGHGGNDPGVQTAFYFSREKGFGMIVLQNTGDGSRTEKLKEMYAAGLQMRE